MRCSACSAVVKPVVAIDIDGTLGNYHQHFIDFAEDWLGVHLLSGDTIRVWDLYDGAGPFRDWFTRTYDVDVTTFRQIKLAYRQGGLKRTMPVYDGAVDLSTDVRALGAELWLTTTRPHDRYDRVDPDTREWLRRNGIGHDALLFGEHKLDDLRERVDLNRVVAVLDDIAAQVGIARDLFGANVGILRRTVWNRGVTADYAVEDLRAARLMIQARVEDWRRYNEETT